MSGEASRSPDLVLLIMGGTPSPLNLSAQGNYDLPPIGILSIASVLQAHGYRVRILDMLTQGHSLDRFLEELRGIGEVPLAVGISTFTETVAACLELAAEVKRRFPATAVVLGGPHPTFCWEGVLHAPAVDYVVRGEGECTMVELLEAIAHPAFDARHVRGLAFRGRDGEVVVTPDRGMITVLDQLPFPALDLCRPRRVLHLVSSRGCPGRCMFCASRALSGARYRMHSAEWLVSVLYHRRMTQGFGAFGLMDDTFTADKRRTARFCALLDAVGLRQPWTIKSRVDYINDSVIRTLRAARCHSVHIGVESADDGVLESIGKNITLAQIKAAIEVCARHGMRVEASFIIGHACDTRETIERTLILALAMQEIGITAIAISTPFPGTRLHDEAEALGLRVAVQTWQQYNLITPIYSTAGFTLNDLRRAIYLYHREALGLKKKPILTSDLHEHFWDDVTEWAAGVKRLASQESEPAHATA